MIEKIFLANAGSYDATGASLDNLKDVNFIYGSNGAGKTTVSRVIADIASASDCNLTWRNAAPLETRVYNRDFVRDHFDENSDIKGIYTFGKNVEVDKEIKTLNKDRVEIEKDLTALRHNLNGSEGKNGKQAERNKLDDQFKRDIWAEKKKYDDLKTAFTGFNKDSDKFRDQYLQKVKTNTGNPKTLDELRNTAKTVFANDLAEEDIIVKPDYGALIAKETDAILKKKIIGKDDINIAALIKKLGNSDWIRKGQEYLEHSQNVCPFCQQKVSPQLQNDLENYFDESYVNDIKTLDTLFKNYETEANDLLNTYNKIADHSYHFLDKSAMEKDISTLRITLKANIADIKGKKDNPSLPVNLNSTEKIFQALENHMNAANDKAAENNDIFKNQAERKRTLTDEIWQRFLEDTKTIYTKFNQDRTNLDKAIEELKEKVNKKAEKLEKTIRLINDKEREITSIKPTIDDINNLLTSFGFQNFHLIESTKNGFYEIHRRDGTDARNTLSEGEKSFITFLYFYFWIKGSFDTSGGTTDRVLVFDDPVSSLDSDILFIVCNLILKVINEMHTRTSHIKQLFILTHNVYFHREIVFQKEKKKKPKDGRSLSHGFWVIRKLSGKSEINPHFKNPVKSSYELLWQEVRQKNPSSAVIQNVLRRILEHYFTFYGGIDTDKIIDRFNGPDKNICMTLFSWINHGSHYTHDDLYISCTDEQVQRYLNVFQRIFEETEHAGHYKMMMKDDYVPLPVTATSDT